MVETKEMKISGEQAIQLYQAEKAKIDVVQRKLESISRILMEVNAAEDSLKAIKNSKQGENILVPLGAGIYIDVKVDNVKQAKNSLAGSVMLDENVDSIIKKLNEQKKEALKNIETLQKERGLLTANINNLGAMLSRVSRQRSGAR